VAEVNAALAGAASAPEKTRPIHILFVAGTKDHGIGEHDYPAFQKAWSELLAAASDTNVSTAWSGRARTIQTGRRHRVLSARDWNEKRRPMSTPI